MATHPEILDLALRRHQAGDLGQAEQLFQQVLQFEPTNATALHRLGILAQQTGQHPTAIEYLRRALAADPSEAFFHFDLGVIYHEIRRWHEAAACYREFLAQRFDYAEAHNNLGNALLELGRPQEAIDSYQQALLLKPDYAEAHNNQGAVLSRLGCWDEARRCYQTALSFRPDYAEAHNNLGIMHRQLGQLDRAGTCFQHAVHHRPNFPAAWNNLGGILAFQGRSDEAIACFQEALRRLPNYPEALNNLGNVLRVLGRLDEAITNYEQALQQRPEYTEAHNNLGNARLDRGQSREAIAHFREALRLDPQRTVTQSNFLFCLCQDPQVETDVLFAEHLAWGERHAKIATSIPAHANDRSPRRRLRIGYVSPEFRACATAQFLEPILANHAASQFEIFCYADVAAPDAVTQRLRQRAHGWHATYGLSNVKLAETIRADGIDLLIDLSGHTADHRLLAFALKPAPVQVTYLGYPCTTGLRALDYRLTDEILDPSGACERYTEELVRLPNCFCCFQPPNNAPEVGPPPLERNGYITFGSLHRLSRLNAEVVELWRQILAAIPSSRLRIFRHTLRGKVKEDWQRLLADRGLPPDRVDLHGAVPEGESHLSAYAEIDISLDTWPWSGHTTACESLWMGVPFVTLRGQRAAGRMVASVLTQTGLRNWIADTQEQYRELAVRMALERSRFAQLRTHLRERLRTTLCDGVTFTRNLETAYRNMWLRWCETSNKTESD